jgi:hypothetical protein
LCGLYFRVNVCSTSGRDIGHKMRGLCSLVSILRLNWNFDIIAPISPSVDVRCFRPSAFCFCVSILQ